MGPVTTAIVSRGLYDMLISGAKYTKKNIENKLKDIITSDEVVKNLAEKLEKINVDEDMSEKVIEKKIVADKEICELIKNIKNENSKIINQQHFGVGDNIGNNKNITG